MVGNWARAMNSRNRIDGMPALSMYHLPMAAAPRSMDMGLMYKAMEQGQVTMIAANATDGPLEGRDWTLLADDKKVFGSYQACMMARQDVLTAEPGLKPALAELSGKIRQRHDAQAQCSSRRTPPAGERSGRGFSASGWARRLRRKVNYWIATIR